MVYSFKTPGVYYRETTRGNIATALQAHDRVYMLGYSATGVSGELTPVYSATDFYNQFGASLSTNSVKLYFAQRHNKPLFFLNVAIRSSYTITLASVTPSTVYSVTIDGFTLSHTATDTDTPTTVLASLTNKVNTSLSTIADMISTGVVRVNQGLAVSVSAGLTLSSVTTPTYPTATDVIRSLDVLPKKLDIGFLIAPEFFQATASQTDRTNLANEMIAFCSDPRRLWVALIDPGATVAEAPINAVITEKGLLQDPRGHGAIYYPYWVDTAGNKVPQSAAVAGVALRRQMQEGFTQPPAGVEYPVFGVNTLTIDITDTMQDVLNPLDINCARVFTGDYGRVIYGARTLSPDPYVQYVSQRVVCNVLGRTLVDALKSLVLSTVDGNGLLFNRVYLTAVGVCERIRLAGGLFGATAADAYLVVCDNTNNIPDDLQNGIVRCLVAVKLSPVLEFLDVNVVTTSLGEVFTTVATKEDNTDNQDNTDNGGDNNA